MVDLTRIGDEWSAGGMRADTANGAAFHYRIGPNGSPNLRNPNSGNPPDNRTVWATSISHPVGRGDFEARFAEVDCQIAGGYSPPHPPPATALPTQVNVAWYRTPDGRVDADGAVARVVIDLPPGIELDQLVLTSGTAIPPASAPIVLVRSIGVGGDAGTVNAGIGGEAVSGINWVLSAVPEPGALGLVLVGAFAVFLRR
jgi:hypothetical protein